MLKYDPRRNVFYNDYGMINGWFNILNSSTGEVKTKKHFHRNYPVIKLGSYEYDYIAGIVTVCSKHHSGRITNRL